MRSLCQINLTTCYEYIISRRIGTDDGDICLMSENVQFQFLKMQRKRLAVGLCRDPLGELTAIPQTSYSWN